MLSFEISNIHFSLKNSFNNIKKDMSDLIKWSHQQSSTQNQKIRELELKIARLEGAFVVQQKPQKTKEILVQKLPREEQIEEEMDLNPSIQKMYEALPNAYKSLLIRLTTLSKEGASKWVYMKDLTRDLYPTTSYKDVKSMISSYTDKLLDYGLIIKQRKGREVILTLTKKAQTLLAQEKKLLPQKTSKE